MKGCLKDDWCKISRFTYVLKFLMKLPRGKSLMATSVGGSVSESVARMTMPNVPCPSIPVYMQSTHGQTGLLRTQSTNRCDKLITLPAPTDPCQRAYLNISA